MLKLGHIYGSDDSGYTIGELTTSYMRDVVDMEMVGQAHSSWHSHGTNGFYWVPSMEASPTGIRVDIMEDVSRNLVYGYTSTAFRGGTLWQFRASEFSGDYTFSNGCKFLSNLSGTGSC